MDGLAGIIQGARDKAGGGGFADAAHAGEHIGLGDAPGGHGIGEGAHHGFLADKVSEILRTVFAGEDAVALSAHGVWCFRHDCSEY